MAIELRFHVENWASVVKDSVILGKMVEQNLPPPPPPLSQYENVEYFTG